MIQRVLLGIGILTAGLWLLTGLVMADQVPRPQGLVNDYADVLGVTERLKLERDLRNFKVRRGRVITLVTIADLHGEDLTTYTTKLSQDWKVQSQPDHPIIVAVDTSRNKAVINMGFGLEGLAPDSVVNGILDNELNPRLRAHDYYGALHAAVEGLKAVDTQRAERLRNLHAALIFDPKSAAAIRLFLGVGGLPGVYIAAYVARRRRLAAGTVLGLLLGMLLGSALENNIWFEMGLAGGVFGLVMDITLKYAWQQQRKRVVYPDWWSSWGGWRSLWSKRRIIPVRSAGS